MVESKIKELCESNKTIYFFDVDGVLAPLELGEYNHYYYDDEKWNEMLQTTDFYDKMRPNKTIQKFLETKDMSKVYVITKGYNDVELQQKIHFCFKNYGILNDHVFLVHHDDEKLDIIKQVQKEYPDLESKYFVMIDDTVSVLNHVMENSNFSTVHISSFFD